MIKKNYYNSNKRLNSAICDRLRTKLPKAREGTQKEGSNVFYIINLNKQKNQK